MSRSESHCSADRFCRSAAFPCPSGTSEESQKAKVKRQKSKARTRLPLPGDRVAQAGKLQAQRSHFEWRLRLYDPEVATLNSSWELTAGSSSKEKPTVTKAVTVATPLTNK